MKTHMHVGVRVTFARAYKHTHAYMGAYKQYMSESLGLVHTSVTNINKKLLNNGKICRLDKRIHQILLGGWVERYAAPWDRCFVLRITIERKSCDTNRCRCVWIARGIITVARKLANQRMSRLVTSGYRISFHFCWCQINNAYLRISFFLYFD